ncbi:MAG: ABC transporter ATP-binding protein [Firmicutes bacterium]|nr:ABC transporter ATP-binding protein [Bacillota bacterium]
MEQEYTLQIENLRSSFLTDNGEVKAVNEVSINVPKGSIVGIVGESGCGKSMTARSVMRLLKYPGRIMGGSILLEGKDLTQLSEKEMQSVRGGEISMIFQEPMTSLNPVVKVGKQVSEAAMLHQNISAAEAKELVLEIFRRVGISEAEKRYESFPHQLSGGLRQRVMIAMAMICRPKLLIADEPTTALDVTVEAQILKLMKQLRDETGMSIIIISHNLGVIAELCDYVYVMYAGRVVEEADVFTLFESPRHPYTKGLLNSVSALELEQERLETIPGSVPNLRRLPAGCAFCARCAYAMEHCPAQLPELQEVSPGHRVRCHLVEGGAANGEQ